MHYRALLECLKVHQNFEKQIASAGFNNVSLIGWLIEPCPLKLFLPSSDTLR